ncbi:glycoside hydrolase family 32 protein [Luteolibacter sp. GHJ8]|uniref:Glycoside hydrolase family 32 protein n=1 Tax=Luteolibacter rhizosphaerae TaxID=2989719 RepID=A0ABT3G6U9_9BACT|nr:glycoside hydrolase family 32 protein [Luteolibacter rhizosphaerae]MCW1915578.1 glycoside hydrolase family 32 protein [Luteolibacter rhizosphaerae]
MTLRLALISPLLLGSALAAEDILIADFEGASYAPWQASGTAFNAGPARGSSLGPLEISNAVGGGVACSENFNAGGGTGNDGPQGKLLSPAFTIERKYIAYRIGGGDYERHACMNLLVDGKIVKSATGRNSDALYAASWDVSAWSGKQAQIDIVDEASGGWGHILVDHLVQTDAPPVLPVVTTPVYQEAARPLYHFTARQWTMDRLNPGMRQEGWLNDLNGMIYYKGEYHMFAQRWNKCWIHAVSKDLVHWEELQPAFWEEALDTGVQSGSCVIDVNNSSGLGQAGGEPPMVAFWSRNDNKSHCISYSLDRGRTWQHYANNPVFVFPERDPKVFWHAASNKWVMVMYGSDKYHIFTSTNLLTWNNENNPIPNAFECPDFFELAVEGSPGTKKWVLVYADGRYSIGNFNGTKFTEEQPRQLGDIGGVAFYATQSFDNVDTGDGRRIQVAWMRESNFAGQPFSQQVTFPCELKLKSTPAGLRMFRQPVREITKLAGEVKSWPCETYTANRSITVSESGEAFRIEAEVEIPQGSTVLINVRGMELRLQKNSLRVGDSFGSIPDDVKKVEILVDRASVEAFVNEGQISCTKVLRPNAPGITLKVQGGEATVHSLKRTALKGMW